MTARQSIFQYLVLLALLSAPGATTGSPTSPHPESAVADAEAWGMLSTFPGQQWRWIVDQPTHRGGDYIFEWTKPGVELVMRDVRSRAIPLRITRNAASGSLEAREDGWWTRIYTGHVQSDGSIAFDWRAMGMRRGIHLRLDDEGVLHHEVVVYRNDQGRVEEALSRRYAHTGQTPPIPASVTGLADRQEDAASARPLSTTTATRANAQAQIVAASSVVAGDTAQATSARNPKWARLGPLSHFVNAALYDEREQDFIFIGESEDGDGLGIFSPDRSPTDIALRAIATTNRRGGSIFVRFAYGIDGFKQDGNLRSDGSIKFSWRSRIIGGWFEDTMTLTPAGCLRWTQFSRTSGTEDSTVERTFCQITDDTIAVNAARRHVERNKRLGLDTDSFRQNVAVLETRRRDEEAARKRDGGSGLLGATLGAVAGIAAAKAYGGDAEQVASAALMGASMGNPNSAVFAQAATTFQDEMGKKHAEQAAAEANVAQASAQAEAIERQRQQREQEAARSTQAARVQPQAAVADTRDRATSGASTNSSTGTKPAGIIVSAPPAAPAPAPAQQPAASGRRTEYYFCGYRYQPSIGNSESGNRRARYFVSTIVPLALPTNASGALDGRDVERISENFLDDLRNRYGADIRPQSISWCNMQSSQDAMQAIARDLKSNQERMRADIIETGIVPRYP